jgi:hypothetical protein
VIETKSRGISGVDDIDPDLKLTLDAWELKLFEFNYREALLIRYIVGELGGDADERCCTVAANVWRQLIV